ncbi:hypothetical protein VNO77_27061 [Canavalia gladiata]|uniref:Uncharacterized protein n=1 Tax=Canavalia gladiata TaxID=3824 RepID=A0AAN9Q6T3_CANGL
MRVDFRTLHANATSCMLIGLESASAAKQTSCGKVLRSIQNVNRMLWKHEALFGNTSGRQSEQRHSPLNVHYAIKSLH